MKTIAIIACISIFFISCTKDRLTADGNIITEIRNPGTFTGIHNSGSTPIYITYGQEYKVEIKGSGNIVPWFKSTISGNTLNLGFDNVNIRHDDIEVFVTMPAINQVSLSGSGKLQISGSFPLQDRFSLTISGSADATVHDAFNAREVTVNISGSGSSELEKIQSLRSDIRISGSGNAHVNVQESLKVRISGSGKVYYTGNALVDSDISGSGRVIHF